MSNKKIIECVPNFSEGRNQETIDAIADAIRKTNGCSLLDVDAGASTNRTVYTFVGDEKAVVNGAFNAAAVAKDLIDMRTQTGEHPRMGAMDVCPFVPVANVTTEECVECSKQFAERAAKELGLAFYLYEEASERDYRKRLPDIRKGEYEAMAEKVTRDGWEPDYWSGEFDPKWGVTATGSRFFLIAYNINVLAPHNQAHRIALNLREAGRGEGKEGRLKETKGMGWYVDEYGMAQITMNLNNYKVTPMHLAFEEAKKDASELGISLAGSELVGLIPLEAMLMAAEYYIERDGLFIYDESQKIKLVIDRLGLNSVSQFIPDKRIIEYIIVEKRDEPLASMTLRAFTEEVAARTTAPGGGSVAAAIAGLGTGLGAMVTQLTYGVRKYENVSEEMKKAIPNLIATTQSLIPKVDEDTNAFNDYIDAIRLPKNTDEEKTIRTKAMQDGLKKAILSPLSVMKLGDGCWEQMEIAARYGNFASVSDIEVGTRALELGIWGAWRNVMVNMTDIEDESWKRDILAEAEEIKNRAKVKCDEILEILDKRAKSN
jgi:glutamate formiminotransferase